MAQEVESTMTSLLADESLQVIALLAPLGCVLVIWLIATWSGE